MPSNPRLSLTQKRPSLRSPSSLSPDANKFAPLDAELDLDPKDVELRQGLAWQKSILEAIFTYCDLVPAAFESLVQAHELIEQVGMSISDDVPDTTLWLDRLREAKDVVVEVVGSNRESLKTIHGTVQACYADLKQADSALAEVKRYEQKIEVLTNGADNSEKTSEKKGLMARMSMAIVAGSKKEQESPAVDNAARLDRNREKMESWAHEANVRQARARDLLEAIKARQEGLLSSIQSIFCSVVRAVGVASGSAPTVRSTCDDPPEKPADGPLTFSFTVQPGVFSLIGESSWTVRGIQPGVQPEARPPPSESQAAEEATKEKARDFLNKADQDGSLQQVLQNIKEHQHPQGPGPQPSLQNEPVPQARQLTPVQETTVSPATSATGNSIKRAFSDELESYGDGVRDLANPDVRGEDAGYTCRAAPAGTTAPVQSVQSSTGMAPEAGINSRHDAQAVESKTDQLQALSGQWNKGTISGDKLTWLDGKTTQLRMPVAGIVEITCDGTTITGELQKGKLKWSNGEEWSRIVKKEFKKQDDLHTPLDLPTETGSTIRRSLLSHQVLSPFQEETEEEKGR